MYKSMRVDLPYIIVTDLQEDELERSNARGTDVEKKIIGTILLL
jgi:hypothetical protein